MSEIKEALLRPQCKVDNVEKINFTEVESLLNDVYNIMTNSYGPKYMNSIICNGLAADISHDGFEIIKSLVSIHPFGKQLLNQLINISSRLNIIVGDGTTTAVVFTISLAKKLLAYIDKNANDPYIGKDKRSLKMDTCDKVLKIIDATLNGMDGYVTPVTIEESIDNLLLSALGSTNLNNLNEDKTVLFNIAKYAINQAEDNDLDYIDISENTANVITSTLFRGFEFIGNIADTMFVKNVNPFTNYWEIKNADILFTESDISQELDYLISNILQIPTIIETLKESDKTIVFMSPKYSHAFLTNYHELYYYAFEKYGYQPFIFMEYNHQILETSGALDDFIELYETKVIQPKDITSLIQDELQFHNEEPGSFFYVLMDMFGLMNSSFCIDASSTINSKFYVTVPSYKEEAYNRIRQEILSSIDRERNLTQQIGILSGVIKVLDLKRRLSNLEGKRVIISVGGETRISTVYFHRMLEDMIKVYFSAKRSGIISGQMLATFDIINDENDSDIHEILLNVIQEIRTLILPFTPPINGNDYNIPIAIESNEESDKLVTSLEHDKEILRGAKDFIRLLLSTEYIISDYILPKE